MIDLQSSILNMRLVRDDGFWINFQRWFMRVFFYLWGLITFIGVARDFSEGVVTDNLPISRIIFHVVILIIASFIVYSTFQIDRLRKIDGTTKNENEELISEILKAKYPKMNFLSINNELLGFSPWKWNVSSREVIVLFKDSELFINMTHMGNRLTIGSIFHTLSNQVEVREIEKVFLEQVKNKVSQSKV